MLRDVLRQGGLCLTALFSTAAFSVISPFYPAVAIRQGIPNYLIGFIFSTFPIASIILSAFLPSQMIKIGRTPVLIIGFFLIFSSNILISYLEFYSTPFAILSSFISRSLSGFGSACVNVSVTASLSSDYPEKISMLIALCEIFGGLGLIIGPTVGSVLFLYGGFQSSCRNIGLAVLIWIPILYLLIGKSRPYEITKKEDINMQHLAKKPVYTIQLILLNALMPFCAVLSIGFNLPIIELHMISFGIEENAVGYWFSSYTVGYIACSTLLLFPYTMKKTKVMCIGMFLLAIGYLFLGPSPLLFSKNLILMALGLHFIGWSISLLYSNRYSVPSIPFMIESAHLDYGFEKDDRLNDAISGIVNIALSAGEIVGPIIGGNSSIFFSYDVFFTIIAGVYFIYGVFYIFASKNLASEKVESSFLGTALVEIIQE